MNPPKCDDLDYIHFLVTAQKAYTRTEASRSQLQVETLELPRFSNGQVFLGSSGLSHSTSLVLGLR